MVEVEKASLPWAAKFNAAFSWRKLPGHALWVIGLSWRLLDYGGRLDMLSRITEALGGEPAVVASVLLSPWTSGVLITVGMSYVIFVGEPKTGALRHNFWPYLGWTIFSITLLSMLFIVGRGAIELYGRQEYAKGLAGAPRQSPSNPQNDTGKPLYAGPRSLTVNQQRILISEAARLRDELGSINVTYLDTDMESWAYANEFRVFFARAAVQSAGPNAQILSDPTLSGIMIEVNDPSHPPKEAVKLQQLMTIIDIDAKFIPNSVKKPELPVVLFIGPRELQR